MSINPEPEQLDCMDMDQNWTERKTDVDLGLGNLDLMENESWTRNRTQGSNKIRCLQLPLFAIFKNLKIGQRQKDTYFVRGIGF